MARTRSLEFRQYKRARERVLTRLAQAHPDEYQRLLQEERANELDKRDSVGSRFDNTSMVVEASGNSLTYRQQPSNSGSYKGDNGGEA